MSARRTAHRESGASLILMLVALTVFGLLVPVLGQFGSANGVSGYIVKGLRFDRYSADNGVQGAIALAQTDRTMGRAHVPCPDVTSSMNVGSTAFRRDVVVKCQGFAGSGDPVGSPSTPKYAVLGLDGGEHSIDVDSSGRLKTSGPWWANGDPGQTSADIHGVTIDASTDLFGAQGGCREAAGAHIYAAPKRCDTGKPELQDVTGTIPDLNGVVVDLPVAAADACASIQPNGVVSLPPGIHWNLDWLNALTDGSCRRDVVIHLIPGVQYVDVDFYDPSRSGSDASQWQIGGSGGSPVAVVGGASTSWGDAAGAYRAASHPNSATTPGACDLGQDGVELVLGSRSNITIQSAAHVELCPRRATPGLQQISISGPTSGRTAEPQNVVPGLPMTAVGATVDRQDQFTWPNAPTPLTPIGPIRTRDCSAGRDCGAPGTNYLEGVLSSRGRGEATITMDVPNPFTKNDRLDALTIDISHRETENDEQGGGNGKKNRITEMWFEVTGLGAPRECRNRRNLDKRDDWTQDTVLCDIGNLKAPLPDPASVPTLKVILHIATNGGERGSVAVDVDQVALRGAETALTPRLQACDCDALNVDNNGNGNAASAYVWGTVVLPTADVNEDFGGSTTFGLKRGVIARRFKLENLANDPNFIPVSLPGGGIYADRIVEFEAQISGKPKLRARVAFPDPVAKPLDPPNITVWDTHP